MPIGGIHQRTADDEKRREWRDLDGDHDVVGFSGLAHAAHQQHGQDEDDEERWKLK